MITRNASRLQNLAESILQVSRIESGSFSLDIQKNVDFHNLVSQVIEDVEKKYAYKEKANRVSILFLPFDDHRNSGSSRDSGAEAEAETKAADTKQAQKEKQQPRATRKKWPESPFVRRLRLAKNKPGGFQPAGQRNEVYHRRQDCCFHGNNR